MRWLALLLPLAACEGSPELLVSGECLSGRYVVDGVSAVELIDATASFEDTVVPIALTDGTPGGCLADDPAAAGGVGGFHVEIPESTLGGPCEEGADYPLVISVLTAEPVSVATSCGTAPSVTAGTE